MNPRRFAALAAAALAGMALLQGFADAPGDPDLVRIDGATVLYREPGEFLAGTTPVNGPIATIRADRGFAVMKRQVTRGEYDVCVAAGACKALDAPEDPALPVVGVSFDDATAYAAFLSRRTGARWRLPTDREWALAAGSRYRDDAATDVSDPANPSRRWLATYDAEAARGAQTLPPAPQPAGSFGANEHGILDLSGNVWDWTTTCFTRHRLDTGKTGETCGVRIAEGGHRAYVTDFIRDPKAGACSVGIPPTHLGIRLVRADGGLLEWLGF